MHSQVSERITNDVNIVEARAPADEELHAVDGPLKGGDADWREVANVPLMHVIGSAIEDISEAREITRGGSAVQRSIVIIVFHIQRALVLLNEPFEHFHLPTIARSQNCITAVLGTFLQVSALREQELSCRDVALIDCSEERGDVIVVSFADL